MLVLALIEVLQAQLELQDPLVLVVRSQLLGMICQLLGTIALQLLRKVGQLGFELLVWDLSLFLGATQIRIVVRLLWWLRLMT